jgi:hypothetical protein
MRPFAWTLVLVFAAALAPMGVDAAKVGGKVSPAGDEIHIDLPENLHRKNVSSRGQGCCVFTSIHHASLWQHVPQLNEFPKWLQAKGLTGGGYSGNVTERIKKICQERGVPEPAYIQIHGSVEEDLKLLSLATKTGRFPAVTYGISPTKRYGGGRIAHMVSLPHADLDKDCFCVLDNNYIGINQYEWMTKAEFVRAYTSGGRAGWSVILLDPGPPPVPYN